MSDRVESRRDYVSTVGWLTLLSVLFYGRVNAVARDLHSDRSADKCCSYETVFVSMINKPDA